VIEAATENLELKLKLYREIDKHARPDVILASNTSSISLTRLGAATKRPEKVVGMHFFNPVPLMTLVEIVKGLGTGNGTITTS
jgi:3-hydroxybutyryl-CoA dehydrogenase